MWSGRTRLTARPYFLPGVLSLLTLAGACLYSLAVRTPEPPRARLETPEFNATDLGQGKVGDVLTGNFYLRNRGSAPLDFQLAAGCACAELSPMQGQILPGEVQPIHVGVRLRYRGRQEVVNIQVQTNDPDVPGAMHSVIATNVAPFVAAPAFMDFGTVVDDGKPRTASLRVHGPDGKGLPADVIVSAVAGTPHLAVEAVDGQPGEPRFRVTLGKGLPRGHFVGTITLRATNDEAPYDVAVVADVRGLLSYAPRTVFLRTFGGPGEECSILVWRTDGKPLGKLIDQQVPKGITVESTRGEVATRQMLKIAATGSWDPDGPGHIRLRFQNVLEDVVIEVRPQGVPPARSGAPRGGQCE